MNRGSPAPRLAALAALLLVAGPALAAEAAPPAWSSALPLDRAAFIASVEGGLASLRGFGSRGEGEGGEAAATAWIFSRLKAAGLSPALEALSELVADQSDARAVSVHIEGQIDQDLLLVLPLDTHPDAPQGEGDGAIALVLAELERLAALHKAGIKPPAGLEVLFLPADRRGPVAEGLSDGPGPAWWIERHDTSAPKALVYLSLDRIARRIELRNADQGLLSPWWLFDRVQTAVRGSGLGLEVHPNRMQGYRLGLIAGAGPIAPFLQADIPSVELREREGGRASDAPAFARLVEGLLAASDGGFPESWDRNYSSFRLGSLSLEVREGPYVLFLLSFGSAVALLLLGLSLRRRHLIPRLLSKLPHRLLNLGLLGLFAAASIFLSLACLGLETLVLGSAEAWKLAPVLFALSRLLMSFFAFLGLLSFAVALRLISPDPWFYEIAALLLFGFDIILFAFLSLPLSLYFCWGFLIVLLSLLLRRRWASLLSLPLMVLPVALVIAALMVLPGSSALSLLVAPDPRRGLLLSLVLLPFATMSASPLLFFAPRGLRRRHAAGFLFLGLALLTELGPLSLALKAAPRAPVELRESFDQDGGRWTALLSSHARLGRLSLARAGQGLALTSLADRLEVQGSDSTRPLGLESSSRFFLDRETSSLVLLLPASPQSLRLLLHSDRPLTIYDCSLPYRVNLDGREAQIFVGPGKGRDLSLSLTTDKEFSGRLEVEASFPHPILPWTLEGGRPLEVGPGLISASFPLGGPR